MWPSLQWAVLGIANRFIPSTSFPTSFPGLSMALGIDTSLPRTAFVTPTAMTAVTIMPSTAPSAAEHEKKE